MAKYFIYSDGGSRGNPGPAAYGFVIQAVGNSKFETRNSKQILNPNIKIIKRGLGYLGETTNNQAEYQAVIAALEHMVKLSYGKTVNPEIHVFLDSQLIVEQMNGRYKIKNEGLKPLFWEVRELIMKLGGRVVFEYIPREKNIEADKLVNAAIDRAGK